MHLSDSELAPDIRAIVSVRANSCCRRGVSVPTDRLVAMPENIPACVQIVYRRVFGSINMRIKTFFMILAVLVVIHGIGFVFVPDQVASAYGLASSASSRCSQHNCSVGVISLGRDCLVR